MIASSDAEMWTEQTRGTVSDLQGVHYANGTWVAVGQLKTYGPSGGTKPAPTFHDVILTSSDGLVWVVRNSRYSNSATTRLYDVYYGDYGGDSGEWIATGDGFLLASSDNGETWAKTNIPGRLHAIHYANDTWVAVGRQETSNPLQPSADFICTSAVSSGSRGPCVNKSSDITVDPAFDRATPFPRLHGVHYADSTWVAVGEGGIILTSADDGDTWTAQQSGVYAPDLQSPSLPLRDVHYADGTWVVVGRAGQRGTILTSTDTVTWAPIPQGFISTYRLNRVHYADSRWIAVGDYDQSRNNGVRGSATDPIFVSSDGTTWADSDNDNDVASILADVHYGNGMWVAVGQDGAVFVTTAP